MVDDSCLPDEMLLELMNPPSRATTRLARRTALPRSPWPSRIDSRPVLITVDGICGSARCVLTAAACGAVPGAARASPATMPPALPDMLPTARFPDSCAVVPETLL